MCGHYKRLIQTINDRKRFCPSLTGHYIRMATISVATISEVYCISYWTMTRKRLPVHVVAYEEGYMYNFDIEINHVLRFIDEFLIKLVQEV